MKAYRSPTVIELAHAGSTNDEAFHILAQASQPSLLIWTTHQTSGRGSRGRNWLSPKGTGLAVSGALVCPPFPHPAQFCYPLFAAVWLHEALITVFPRAEFHLKWPNDLLLEGRKLAGILCESRLIGERATVVLGLGINLADHPGLAALDRPYATLEELPFPAEPQAIIDAMAQTLPNLLETLGDRTLIQSWLDRCGMNLGQRLRICQGQVDFHGYFTGLSQDGCLLLQTDDGTVHTFSQTLEDCVIVKTNEEEPCS